MTNTVLVAGGTGKTGRRGAGRPARDFADCACEAAAGAWGVRAER